MQVNNVAVLGAGFIGKNLISLLNGKGYRVKVLDNNYCPEIFQNKVEWTQGSFSNEILLEKVLHEIDVAYHLISSTVPGDLVDETEELKQNVLQTIIFLKTCMEKNVKRVIFISSSSVYGLKKKLPISEIEITDPISSHGINKLAIEKYLLLFKYKYNLDSKIIRLSNPYGRWQNINGRQGFIAIIVGKILSGLPINIRGDGKSIRDYIHISDVTKACELLALTNSNEVVFNIGSGCGNSLNDIIHYVEELIGKKLKINYIDERSEDIPASILDISKAKTILNFIPEVLLHEGIKQTLGIYGLLKPEPTNKGVEQL